MGFGASTTVGNVSVDMVQADVDALIAGIADGKTLSDVEQLIASVDSELDAINLLLTSIDADTSFLSGIDSDTGYLYSSSAAKGVADLLWNTSASASVADMLHDGTYSAGYYLGQIYSYESSNNSYLSGIDSDTYYLYSSSAGYGVADELYQYLYDSSNFRGLIDYFNTSNQYEPLFYSGQSLARMIYDLWSCISGGRLLVTDQHP